MAAITFDSLQAVKILESAGVDRKQAEAVVEVVAKAATLPDVSELATKADLSDLRTDLANAKVQKVQIVLAVVAIVALMDSVLFFLLRR